MEYLVLIITILFVDFLALVSPGPNFILITSSAVSQSRKHALWTGCGIASGSLVWASAATLGIVSVFEVFPLLGLILKAVGVVYLIYLGVRLLRSRGYQLSEERFKGTEGVTAGYWRGFMVNMTNPKSATYYASVFAAFLTPEMPVWLLVVLVTAIGLMSLIWHAMLAFGFSATSVQRRYIALSKYIDRLCGGLLVYLGIRLALESR